MSITTFAELKTAIGTRTNRTDQTTIIEEAIATVESRLNRTLRHPEMLVKDDAFAISSRYTSVPAGFLEDWRLLRASDRVAMARKKILRESPSTGTPREYVIVGTSVQVDPVPSSSTNFEFWYFKKITALSVSNTSNWLLAGHADVYLYGACLEVAINMQDETRAAIYGSRAAAAVEELELQAARWKRGAVLTTEMAPRNAFDIVNG